METEHKVATPWPGYEPEIGRLLWMLEDTRRRTKESLAGLDEHLQRLDTARGYLLAAFRDVSLDDFRRPRHFEQYDVTPEWVLHHLMQHEAEHRGQIMALRTEAE